MKLILVRHAEAAPTGENGVSRDADRPLTVNGREQARKLAETFQARGITPDAVVTSPLLRARETVEPLLPLLNGSAREPVVCDYLALGELRPKKLSKFVRNLGGNVIVLVGHNPDLSTYTTWLLGAEETAVDLEKGAAALVECEDGIEKGAGRLVWLVTPLFY
jgi:phosphohistidine phosphatase